MYQFEDQPVRIIEYRVIFHPHARQTGNFKKSPVGKLTRRIAP